MLTLKQIAFAFFTSLLLSTLVHAHDGSAEAKDADRDTPSERFIHTEPGNSTPGIPSVASSTSPLLSIKIIDAATGDLAMCRVNVIGPEGNYYEPADNPLAP